MTARMMCSIMITAMPARSRVSSRARISSTSGCDRPAMASSAISSCGRPAIARASSSLRSSTCVRRAATRRAFAARPTAASMSAAVRSLPRSAPPVAQNRKRQRARSPRRSGCGRARQLEGAGEAEPGAPVRRQAAEAWPAKMTLPASGRSSPARQLTKVLLPEPFGPIRPSRSPAQRRASCRTAPRSRRSACPARAGQQRAARHARACRCCGAGRSCRSAPRTTKSTRTGRRTAG